MSENVIEFSGITKLDIPAETILRRASEQGLTDVLVIGWQEDGQIYAASSTGNVGKNLHLVEAFKHTLMSGGYEG